MQNIDKFEKKITKLRKKMEKLSVQITTDIWKELKGWKPTKDERTVCFSPQQECAWYVWFVEKQGNTYRFKETPIWESRIQNYYRQEVESQKGGELIVMPTAMFQQLNSELKIGIWNKQEEISAM